MPHDAKIVVIGAGVIGLTTTLQLLRSGYSKITVVARYMPGDRDPTYASPQAGVIFVPSAEKDSREAEWEKESWEELCRLARDEPYAGVWFRAKYSFYCERDNPKEQSHDWWRDLVLDYEYLSEVELPEFADWGLKYRTLSLDPHLYLHYLQAKCLSLGARFRRATISDVMEAPSLYIPSPESRKESDIADIVVNACGLSARELSGVNDKAVVPIRGQLVIVANECSRNAFAPNMEHLNMDKRIGEVSYVIQRPAGGGTALGGTYYETSSTEIDMDVAKRIMENAIRICPDLVPPGAGIEGLDIIRHQIGLRPHRNGGARVDVEESGDDTTDQATVVHAYGVGGWGYQLSYGVANRVARMVDIVTGRNFERRARI